MAKTGILCAMMLGLACIVCCNSVSAQDNPVKQDTFFLARMRGILGRFGKSLVKSPQPEAPVKIAVPFIKYSGRPIRTVEIIPLAFNQSLDDTTNIRENFAVNIGMKLHKRTRTSIIKNYLFFKEGDKVLPFLISDNESYLRNQPFIQDALILIDESGAKDSVDIIVLTRDVFSLGGSINANSRSVRAEVREENVAGAGSQIAVSGIYDMDRKPKTDFGAQFILRNIAGSFLNCTAGYSNFMPAFNSGRYEENMAYTRIEKPLVNRYTQWTAALEASYSRSVNAYIPDSLYIAGYQFKYSNIDLWAGYNIGYKTKKGKDTDKRLRHFVAGRTFYHYFDKIPKQFDSVYNFGYADINGVLFAYTLFKQNFYRTNFIYAFGRNEDVPTGLSASVIAGWTNKEDRRRAYYGLEFEGNKYSKKGFFSSYIARVGGFYNNGRFEDVNLLFSVDHFTKLRKLDRKWLNRNFISFAYSKQLNVVLNEPFFIKSTFGLPYYRSNIGESEERTTLKLETDFYNLNKILGFRFAPFLFTDMSFLKPVNKPFNKTDGYTALGGGMRARNENLIFETIELKAYYFARPVDGMRNFKVDVTTKVRFKVNSNFIRKPDIIAAN